MESTWADGEVACAVEFPGSTFTAPPNGYQNHLIRQAANPSAEVWIAA